MASGTRKRTRRKTAPKKPGPYPGLSEALYDQIRALRCSDLKNYEDPPTERAHWVKEHPKPAKVHHDEGQAAHCLLLRPDDFEGEWIEGLDHDRRSNVHKAAWAEFEEKNRGRGILKPGSLDMVRRMRDAAHAHPLAHQLLSCPGLPELTIVTEDAKTGLLVKVRLDRLIEYDGYMTVVDYKSTARKATAWDFGREIATWRYHYQHAFYLRALESHFGEAPRRFLFLVQEKEPPYFIAIHELDARQADAAWVKVDQLMSLHARCVELDEYELFPNHPITPDVPRWATWIDEEDLI